MLVPKVDYEAATVDLDDGTFLLARGRAGQLSVIDVTRRRIVGSAVVGEDGNVTSSNELAERVITAWKHDCFTNGRDPWPRPGPLLTR